MRRILVVLLFGVMLVVAGRGVAVAAPGQGDPRVDTINVDGVGRTRPAVVVRATGLEPHQVMTPEAFARALRRLRELPVASSAQIGQELVDRDRVRVGVSVEEHHVLPTGRSALAILGVRAVVLHEVRLDAAGALGAGEVGSAAWRWSPGRQRVALGLALPSPMGLPGILSIDGLWERQTYDATPGTATVALVREQRRRAGLHVADWSTSWIRWQAGAGLERLREYDVLEQNRFAARNYFSAESTVDVRLSGDRIALVTSAAWWAPFDGGDQFGTGGLLAAWRSTVDATRPVWSGSSEVTVASLVAPLALWSGAGTGSGRSGLLRAHKLLENGVLFGPAFGRDLAHGSLEYARPIGRGRAQSLFLAGFVDAARAWHRLNGYDTSRLFVDAGIGLRVHASATGTVRLDVAHGLRGGGARVSLGWGAAWPH
jgi:hypothetical protein